MSRHHKKSEGGTTHEDMCQLTPTVGGGGMSVYRSLLGTHIGWKNIFYPMFYAEVKISGACGAAVLPQILAAEKASSKTVGGYQGSMVANAKATSFAKAKPKPHTVQWKNQANPEAKLGKTRKDQEKPGENQKKNGKTGGTPMCQGKMGGW